MVYRTDTIVLSNEDEIELECMDNQRICDITFETHVEDEYGYPVVKYLTMRMNKDELEQLSSTLAWYANIMKRK